MQLNLDLDQYSELWVQISITNLPKIFKIVKN